MTKLPAPVTRKTVSAALYAAVAGSLLFAPAATAGILTPEGGGSPNADKIQSLYILVSLMGLVVFLAVEGVLLWSLYKFKARKGRVAAQIHGNTRLEIGWTVGAALILVVLTVITFIMLPGIQNPEASGPAGLAAAQGVQYAATDQPPPPGGKGLNIKVVGQQYLWRYDYPGPGRLFAYHTMVVPTDTTVTLDITSADVQHSFWIPELFGKADAVPGKINDMWFKVTEEGTYRGNCAELCGENHAQMIGMVKAVSPEAYRNWVARQRADIDASTRALVEQRRRLQSGTPGPGTANTPPQ